LEGFSARTGPSAGDEDDAAHVAPAAWPGGRGTLPGPDSARRAGTPAPTDEDGRVEPTQTAPGDWIVPFLFLTLPGLLGVGEANRQRTERQRLDDHEASGSKAELIPPHVPNEPFRGPDPARPPLDPKATRPSPYPSESPHKPEQERLAPPRIDPRDLIEILPDQSDWIANLPIIVENRQGDPPVKGQNRDLGEPVIGSVNRIFPGVTIKQTGGPTPNKRQKYSEEFDRFRFKDEFGIESNAGGSFKDVSYVFTYKGVSMQIVINTVTISPSDGAPTRRENRQRAKMVLNIPEHALIIDVDKLKPNEAIDFRAWHGFLESRLGYVKWLIDAEILTKDGFNHKMLDRFNKTMRR